MRTRDYIVKGESEGRSLSDAMHDGSVDGMQTFDDELEKLWNQRIITKETALAYATNPTNLALRLTTSGERAVEGTATRCCPCWSNDDDQDHLYELPEAALARRDQAPCAR